MYKTDLALNNLHVIKPNQTYNGWYAIKPNQTQKIQTHHLLFASPSSSCPIAFSALGQDLSICLSFHFLLFLHCGQLKQQNPLDDKVLFLVNWYWVFWPFCQDLVIRLYLKVLGNFMSLFLGHILVGANIIW